MDFKKANKPKTKSSLISLEKHQKKQSSYFLQSRPNLIDKSIEKVSRDVESFNGELKKNRSQSRKASNNQSVSEAHWKHSISRTEVIQRTDFTHREGTHSNLNGMGSPNELNNKLDEMFRQLKQMEKKSYFSPSCERGKRSWEGGRSKSRGAGRSTELTRVGEKEADTRQGYSRQTQSRHYLKSPQASVPPKNQLSSIMAISDSVQESFRLHGFLDNSSRSSQIFPSTLTKNNYSIQYYMLHKKLSSQESLYFQPIEAYKPHKARITSILIRQNGSLTDIYTSSLDYSVARHSQDSEGFAKVRSHREGVECMHWWNDRLLSGGRDCFVRGVSEKEFFKMEGVVNRIEGLKRSENVMVKSKSKLWEVDLQKRRVVREEILPVDFALMSCSNEILLGTTDSLKTYDQRSKYSTKIFSTSQKIHHWQSVNNKILGLGSHLWLYDLPGLQRSKQLPSSGQPISICEYYQSYLISLKGCDLLIYDTDLDMMSSVGIGENVRVANTRNKIVCAYEDGRLECCLIK